jgi:hypothetical protein
MGNKPCPAGAGGCQEGVWQLARASAMTLSTTGGLAVCLQGRRGRLYCSSLTTSGLHGWWSAHLGHWQAGAGCGREHLPVSAAGFDWVTHSCKHDALAATGPLVAQQAGGGGLFSSVIGALVEAGVAAVVVFANVHHLPRATMTLICCREECLHGCCREGPHLWCYGCHGPCTPAGAGLQHTHTSCGLTLWLLACSRPAALVGAGAVGLQEGLLVFAGALAFRWEPCIGRAGGASSR